jgi:hypothetical protein
MRFDRQKAFPYPVLRPDIDDYLQSEFQVTVDIEGTKDNKHLSAKVQVALSSDQIKREITKGNAAVAIIFSCRETYFREAITTDKFEFKKSFDAGTLRGEVVIYPFIVALKSIKAFSAPDINAEFRKESFSFEAGEVLATEEPKVVYIDRELFKPISSILQIVKSESLSGFEWKISFETSKLQILLSAEAKQAVDQARNSRRNRAVLINSIYFSALMEAIQKLKDEEGTYAHLRWAQVILQQCHNAAIDIRIHESYAVAQRLLNSPLSLLNQYVFQENER